MIMRDYSSDSNRGVRFDDSTNQLFEIEPVMYVEEGIHEELWYQPWEQKENKRAMKRVAREWRKTGLQILLNDTFVNPNPKLTQSCLDAFVQLADSEYVRGSERYLSHQHDEQRTGRKRNFIQDVLEQSRYLETCKHMSADEKREKLAEFSQLQSKCAEVFARRIGQADETVAKNGENPSAAAKLISKLFLSEARRSRSMDMQANVMRTHESAHIPEIHRRGSFPFVSL